jgi:hypothetical protein
MPVFHTQVNQKVAPAEETHAVRLGDVRPLRLTKAEFAALEYPVGSGIYPSLKGVPLVLVTDAGSEDGLYVAGGNSIYAESYGEDGVAFLTGATFTDGRFIWKVTWLIPAVTPGVDGTQVAYLAGFHKVIRFEGMGNLSNTGSGGSIPLNGSGFAATVRDGGEVIFTGPAGVTLYRIHFTVWFTKP